MSSRCRALCSVLQLLLLLLAGAGSLFAQTPDGAVSRVNSTTATQQRGPVVSMDRSGRGLILWTDFNQESNFGLAHPRISGQGFSSQGIRLGAEFSTNEPPFQAEGVSGIAMQGNGRFMALWSESFRFYARPYVVGGGSEGPPIPIDLSGSPVGYFDHLVGLGGGVGSEFVGVWRRVNAGDPVSRPFARWFDRSASPLDQEVPLVDALPDNCRPLVDVVAGPNRSVLVGWTIAGFNDAYHDLHVQAYSVSGEKLGAEFLVSHNIGTPQAGLAWNPLTRNFVVAWRSAELFPGSFTERILFQRLSPEGQPVTAEPIVVSETGGIPAAVACNNRGYCAVTWFRDQVGIVVRIIRPDGRVLPTEVLVAAIPAFPNWIAYGGNGGLVVVWTDDYSSADDPADIAARRLIASPGDEVCQRVADAVQCDSGRTGGPPELRLASFGLDRKNVLLFGDVDRDGRADPCRVRNGTWRCDTDHEGGPIEVVLSFAGATGVPLLGDLDGNGRADACTWSTGSLRCDTGHNGGAPELTFSYGRRGDQPLIGDLDGDGRDDLCLWSKGLLRCDVGHDSGRSETRLVFGQAGDQFLLGDFDGNGSDDPCLARAGKLLCDTAHDGGDAEGELVLGTAGAPALLGNLDGV